MHSPILCIEDLHYSYPAPHFAASAATSVKPALRDINLAIEAGECVAVMGATGAGKTTLCLALNGLVPQATGGTFRGNVWVNGHNTRTEPVALLATQVGLVFQEAENQLFTMSVEDEVAFGLENLGLPVDEIERRIAWALEVVGMNDLRRYPPAHLSGGQQQRLALAAVLAMQPIVLVLDEPTAGLDPMGRRALLDAITRLRHQGATIVMATQDAEAVAALADRLVVLQDGTIVLEGTPREVFGHVQELMELGVPVPQMCQLSFCLGNPTPWMTVKEAIEELREHSNVWSPQKSFDVAHPLSGLTAVASGHSPNNKEAGIAALFENVWYRYESGVQALTALDLTLQSGEYIALIGANGSGKSTLARHMNGLLCPQTGCVVVAGLDTRHTSPGVLARQVGYVFQNPDHQIFAPTVRDEIAFGPRNLGLSEAQVRQRVAQALEAFQLVRLADVPPAMLSFGQRRLVTLASVYAMQPKVLVLDEPSSGLDCTLTQRLTEWVSQQHQAGNTIVFITHDMQLAALASRCVVMQSGQIALDTPTPKAFAHPDVLARAGIVPPPIVELGLQLGLAEPPLTVRDFCHFLKQERFSNELAQRSVCPR